MQPTPKRERPRKPYKGPAMEGFIANWYARITRGEARSYRACAHSVAERTPDGGRVLEVAAGPGYLAMELARLGYRVWGIDISRTFVRIATENSQTEGLSIEFREGNASALPYPDASFDFVVCRAAFKNFSDPLGALDEIHRVLVPGGQASIFDLRHEASRDDIAAEVDRMQISPLNRLWTKWTFRLFLLPNAYTEQAMQALAAESPFGAGEVHTSGVELDLRLVRR